MPKKMLYYTINWTSPQEPIILGCFDEPVVLKELTLLSAVFIAKYCII